MTSPRPSLPAGASVTAASLSHSKLIVEPLGSGREVGRSCHHITFKGKRILLDCGVHPGKRGLDGLPFFDNVDLAAVDLCLISHFHLDHVAMLPYLMNKTRFKGRVFMTHPTLAVTKLLLQDYVRVSGVQRGGGGGEGDPDALYTDLDVVSALSRCEKIDFHQQIEVEGIKFTAFNAGHVLGACQYLIEIGGVRILYTGDFSREEDRHLMKAECNSDWRPDVLLVESTFGVQVHESQRERERQFLDSVVHITRRGGKCLIPVFSLGRAQELLLILDDYWSKNPEMQQIPIYHASRLATRSLTIYRRFINSMNEKIRQQNNISNPWELEHVSNLNNPNDFDEPGPAVVLASPGMLQNGTSRKLFEQWAGDPRNGVIIAGYCVEGTLAKDLLSGPREFNSLTGRKLPINCEIKTATFTAHSDWNGTYSYIKQLTPRHTVLVHGEQNEMKRLHDQLKRTFVTETRSGEMDFCMPRNGDQETFVFHEERVVKALGRLADKRSRWDGAPVAGILVSGDLDDKLVAPDELEVFFSTLTSTVLAQRLHVPFHSKFDRLKAFVGKLFEVQMVDDSQVGTSTTTTSSSSGMEKHSLKVLDEVLLTHAYPPGDVLIEWRSSPSNDMVVDAVVALLQQAECGIGGVRISSCFHHEHQPHAGEEHDVSSSLRDQTATLVKELLIERFGEERVSCTNDEIVVLVGGEHHIKVDVNTLQVMTGNDGIEAISSARTHVQKAVDMAKHVVWPLTMEDKVDVLLSGEEMEGL